mmetsp:Transcript_24770/g.38557  ORF Transcript_24770/g.38557 Transcript_24770/m.38557 type:complete len:106 (-) Transcript_24770:18-335(-)
MLAKWQLIQCEKVLINDMCDFDSCWAGPSAQWVETCEESTSSDSITVEEYEISPAYSDQSLIGGIAPSGYGCWKFANWSDWAPYVANLMLNYAGQPSSGSQKFSF